MDVWQYHCIFCLEKIGNKLKVSMEDLQQSVHSDSQLPSFEISGHNSENVTGSEKIGCIKILHNEYSLNSIFPKQDTPGSTLHFVIPTLATISTDL